jgi:hypothetical protein
VHIHSEVVTIGSESERSIVGTTLGVAGRIELDDDGSGGGAESEVSTLHGELLGVCACLNLNHKAAGGVLGESIEITVCSPNLENSLIHEFANII